MKTRGLSPAIVAAVGAVLILLTVAGLFFFLIKPTMEQTSAAQARLDAAAPDATDAEHRKAQKLLDANKIKVQQTKLQWAQKEAALMPPYDVSGDRFMAVRQLTYELEHYLGPDLERYMKTSGVKSTTKFTLPTPPVNPNDITNAPLVIPLGQITVNGSFRDILTHFYDWQYFNRLVLVDGLSLHGNSPYMTGTYTATVFIFPQGDKVPPPIPQAGGGAAGAGKGGGRPGFGGSPGGMGGSPGGMGGPPPNMGGPPGR